MSKHQTKVIVTYCNLKQPDQTYKDLEVWINIDGRESFLKEIYAKECDIFGIIPAGLDFVNNKVIENIVSVFDEYDGLKYIISQEEVDGNMAFFCRKKLADKEGNGFDVNIDTEENLISTTGLFKTYG